MTLFQIHSSHDDWSKVFTAEAAVLSHMVIAGREYPGYSEKIFSLRLKESDRKSPNEHFYKNIDSQLSGLVG